jgi:hypothetical protein
MTDKETKRPPDDEEDLGISRLPLCREPWENFYILRRGIMPCCYGNPIIGRMSEFAETWNSPKLQEIRRYLSQRKLSPYCLESLGCPIVQRVLAEKSKGSSAQAISPPRRPYILRLINRIFFGIPKKIWVGLKKQ